MSEFFCCTILISLNSNIRDYLKSASYNPALPTSDAVVNGIGTIQEFEHATVIRDSNSSGNTYELRGLVGDNNTGLRNYYLGLSTNDRNLLGALTGEVVEDGRGGSVQSFKGGKINSQYTVGTGNAFSVSFNSSPQTQGGGVIYIGSGGNNNTQSSSTGTISNNGSVITIVWDGNNSNNNTSPSSSGGNNFAIQGSIGDFYYNKISNDQRQYLGKATTKEAFLGGNLEWRQDFTTGSIFHGVNGTFIVQNTLRDWYNGLSESDKQRLGMPIGNETSAGGTWHQSFKNGDLQLVTGAPVKWNDGNGNSVSQQPSVISVDPNFSNAYAGAGGANGILHNPTSNPFQINGGWQQNFQGGAIISSNSGIFTLYGGIGSYYLQNEGGANGRLGVPTSGEQPIGNGKTVQHFQNGDILYGNGVATSTLLTAGGTVNYLEFAGVVRSDVGIKLRQGPTTGFNYDGSSPYNKVLPFDAWTTGESIPDPSRNNALDNRWFHVVGTNNWVASAYIYGEPNNSINTPFAQPITNSGQLPSNGASNGNNGNGTIIAPDNSNSQITLPDGITLLKPTTANIKDNVILAKQHKQDLLWFYNMVNYNAPWDYKVNHPEYQDFGNFHYGIVGKAAEFSDDMLLKAAGLAQIKKGTSKLEWAVSPQLIASIIAAIDFDIPLAILLLANVPAPYGDDPTDQSWIRKGIDYYYNHINDFATPSSSTSISSSGYNT